MSSWIYKSSRDDKNRFILGRNGVRTLICIGVNPSTASPDNLDNTLKTVENRTLSLGYDSWVMINIYPQRATKPKDIDKKLNSEIHRDNIKYIKDIFSGKRCCIWAAWGTNIDIRPYLKECLRDIVKVFPSISNEWFTIGKRSKDGHPHHPLYLKKCLPRNPFDIDKYII